MVIMECVTFDYFWWSFNEILCYFMNEFRLIFDTKNIFFWLTFGLLKVPEQMAHFVALEENKDPLPSGDEPRPEDEEAELEEIRSVWCKIPADSLSPFCNTPLTIPVKLSKLGVGEAAEAAEAELTRTPLPLCCCKVAAISDCQAINLKKSRFVYFLKNRRLCKWIEFGLDLLWKNWEKREKVRFW